MRFKDQLSPQQGRDLVEAYNAKVSGQATGKPVGGNKFGAVVTEREGIKHDSKHEADWADKLRLLEKAGKIRNLKLDKRYLRWEIKVESVWICHYTADASFVVVEPIELATVAGLQVLAPDNHIYVADAKSVITRKKRDYTLVKNLMLALHGIEILEL